MKKRFFSVAIALMLIISLIPASAVHANNIRVTVDGQVVNFQDQAPVIVDGRTLVPVRGVFEALGFDVGWNDVTRSAILNRIDFQLIIPIGSYSFTTNGISHSLDVPAQIIGGRTMLPIRFPLESVGYELDWDDATQTVLISTSEPTPTPTQPTPDPIPERIILPNRLLTDEEMRAWIAEYNSLGGISAAEHELIRLLNEFRAANGNLPPVTIHPELMMAARFHAQTLSDLGYSPPGTHTAGPYGGSSGAAQAFGQQRGAANMAGGASPQGAINMWDNSPGHRSNMLSSSVYVGVGIHNGVHGGRIYLMKSNSANPLPANLRDAQSPTPAPTLTDAQQRENELRVLLQGGADVRAFLSTPPATVIPVRLTEVTFFTQEELFNMALTAPTIAQTSPTQPHPNRRMTQAEVDVVIAEFWELGPNNWELLMVAEYNRVRSTYYNLPELPICPYLVLGARLTSQLLEEGHGVHGGGSGSPNLPHSSHAVAFYGGYGERVELFGGAPGVWRGSHTWRNSPRAAIQSWRDSPAHNDIFIVPSGVTAIGFGDVGGERRTTAIMVR